MRICASAGAGRRLIGIGVALGTVLGSGALAAGAPAATLSVNKACYVRTAKKPPTMVLSGAGFTPGSMVLVSSDDGSVATQAAVNPAGAFRLATSAPTPFFSSPGQKTVTLTASDGVVQATAAAAVAPLGVFHGSTKKQPGLRALSEKTNWSFSGFTPGKFIYGHYTIAGKQVTRTKFGRASGPCGLLKTRAKLFPAAPHHKSYPVQWDSSKRYSERTKPKISGRVSLMTVL
ncbi:MAG TPA: hypothetical protein VGH45_05000 [Solirubrobacteraceae bacterium]|jgi:hypothetical protein